ncbi:acyclic terpene utilization AtuA family protein [Mangrovibacillus sp. Mu-81]|jgi:hypothetical protein|uniref:acyclic terpene utilization AtuA family protein n=1 Tax=Mangrovibacillus sp. Mu-81 TaxID=3121478 RepID=UPI002FE4F179
MLKIGSGAGFSGDRLDPAVDLVKKIDLDYLMLECLAERTIAIAQKEKLHDPSRGYDPLLEERMYALLPELDVKRFRIISNMGAANPKAAAMKIVEIAEKLNISIKVAAVTGDDVLNKLSGSFALLENEKTVNDITHKISANAYLGADSILPALESDADIIITGRVADPSLALAPMIHHFGWDLDNYELLGKGTVIGHLLECAGQITGGYFADPGLKEVPNLEELGFPYAAIHADGSAVITKPDNTGGVVNLQTVKEQLLYEVHDPSQYITPDVKADFSTVSLEEIARDQVRVTGGSGKEKPETYKVSIGYQAGFIGEGEISYAGSTAIDRAKLAEEVIKKRLGNADGINELRLDLIGVSSIHRTSFDEYRPYEVRLRAAVLVENEVLAEKVGNEIEALYTNGPYGGGGARKKVSECIGIVSTFLSREIVDLDRKVEVFKND